MWRTFKYRHLVKLLLYADDHAILLKPNNEQHINMLIEEIRNHMALYGLNINDRKSRFQPINLNKDYLLNPYLIRNYRNVTSQYKYLGTEMQSDQKKQLISILED